MAKTVISVEFCSRGFTESTKTTAAKHKLNLRISSYIYP